MRKGRKREKSKGKMRMRKRMNTKLRKRMKHPDCKGKTGRKRRETREDENRKGVGGGRLMKLTILPASVQPRAPSTMGVTPNFFISEKESRRQK